MKISVENLGTIKKGEISLDKELTIFTGENNSGKSYMSYVLYGFLKSSYRDSNNKFYLSYIRILRNLFRHNRVFEPYFTDKGIKLHIEDFITKIETILYSAKLKALEDNFVELFATDNIKPKVTPILQPISEILKNDNNYNSIVTINNKEFADIQEQGVFYLENKDFDYSTDSNTIYDILTLKFSLVVSETKLMFFPAERSGIYITASESLRKRSEILDEISNKTIKGENISDLTQMIPRYIAPINEHIYFANDFKYISQQPISNFSDLASELENIMGGEISISQFGGMEFLPNNTSQKLRLYLTSSLVKSLAGLVIYLRYLAKENDDIFIDEPEINLHPKSQILIARFLAKMVNRGIKIVVSTHSDYILRELSTLIILNNEFEGKEKLLNRYPEYRNQVLAAEKVAVYNFANHTIENIEITNKGIETASIDTVISRQNETSDAMYYTYLDSLPSEE